VWRRRRDQRDHTMDNRDSKGQVLQSGRALRHWVRLGFHELPTFSETNTFKVWTSHLICYRLMFVLDSSGYYNKIPGWGLRQQAFTYFISEDWGQDQDAICCWFKGGLSAWSASSSLLAVTSYGGAGENRSIFFQRH
jgi:hypothetical protein